MNHRLPSEDYSKSLLPLNQSFSIEEESNLKHQFKNNAELIDIIEYSPKDFTKIQKHFGVTKEMILSSINLELNRSNLFNIGEGEGKSGSFFFFTFDKKYLIKTVSPEELRIFRRYMKEYARHLISDLGSILAIIIGIYTLKIKGLVPIHIIFMVNSLPKIESYVIIIHIFVEYEICF